MLANPQCLKVESKIPLYLAIANHFEALIVSGELKHGDKLPPTDEVARLFDVTVPTVQQGLTFLANKGFLKRVQRKGTVVDARPCSKSLALLIGDNPFEIESQYPRLFVAAMDKLAKRDGISIDCHFSLGGGDFARRSRQLREDAKAGRYACLVGVHGSVEMMEWLRAQTEIPFACPVTGGAIAKTAQDGVSYLLNKGHRNIAFVSMYWPNAENASDIGLEYEGVSKAYASHDVPFDPTVMRYWGKTPSDGYERGLSLLKDKKSRPTAVYINHDLLTKGFLKALDELGLKAPEDIALVSHANKGDDFAYPIPVTRLEVDPEKQAEATLRFVKERYMGGRANTAEAPKLNSVKLLRGLTCGEAMERTEK